MQPAATPHKRHHQNGAACKACWLLLKQGGLWHLLRLKNGFSPRQGRGVLLVECYVMICLQSFSASELKKRRLTLITTIQQPSADAKPQKQPPTSPIRLMMNIGRYPLSYNLKNKTGTACIRKLVLRPGFGPGSPTREAGILDRTILPEHTFSQQLFSLNNK